MSNRVLLTNKQTKIGSKNGGKSFNIGSIPALLLIFKLKQRR